MTEREYASQKAALASERGLLQAAEQKELKRLDRERSLVIDRAADKLWALQRREQALEAQWAELSESRERCSKCGDDRAAHAPEHPEYWQHVYLTGCTAFIPYVAEHTPLTTNRKLKSSLVKQQKRAEFWAQNAVNTNDLKGESK